MATIHHSLLTNVFHPYFYNRLWAYLHAVTIQGAAFNQVNTVYYDCSIRVSDCFNLKVQGLCTNTDPTIHILALPLSTDHQQGNWTNDLRSVTDSAPDKNQYKLH